MFGWTEKFKSARESVANVSHNGRLMLSVTAGNTGAVFYMTDVLLMLPTTASCWRLK